MLEWLAEFASGSPWTYAAVLGNDLAHGCGRRLDARARRWPGGRTPTMVAARLPEMAWPAAGSSAGCDRRAAMPDGHHVGSALRLRAPRRDDTIS